MIDGGKDHPRLKPDARFGGRKNILTAFSDKFAKTLEQSDRSRRFVLQKIFDRIISAGMRLIFVGKPAGTFRTFPQRFFRPVIFFCSRHDRKL